MPVPEGALAIISQMMPLILLVAVFYFMIIMPQKKRDKKMKEMLAALKVGDKVVTIGGVCGNVTSIKDDIVTIESSADRTKIAFERASVKSVEQKISE